MYIFHVYNGILSKNFQLGKLLFYYEQDDQSNAYPYDKYKIVLNNPMILTFFHFKTKESKMVKWDQLSLPKSIEYQTITFLCIQFCRCCS